MDSLFDLIIPVAILLVGALITVYLLYRKLNHCRKEIRTLRREIGIYQREYFFNGPATPPLEGD